MRGMPFTHTNEFKPDGTIKTSLRQRSSKSQSSKSLARTRASQSFRNKHHGGNKTMKNLMSHVRKAKVKGNAFKAKTPDDRISFGKGTYAYSKGGSSKKKSRSSRRSTRRNRK